MKIFEQRFENSFAVASSVFKYSLNGILIDILNSRTSPNTVPFCQAGENFRNGLFIGMQTKKDRVVPFGKSMVTALTPEKSRLLFAVSGVGGDVSCTLNTVIPTFRIWAKVL